MAKDIPVCIPLEDIRNAKGIDTELQMLQTYIIRGWLQNKMTWNLLYEDASP